MADSVLVQRPEFVREVETSAFGVVQKPLTTWERIFNNAAVRKVDVPFEFSDGCGECRRPSSKCWQTTSKAN